VIHDSDDAGVDRRLDRIKRKAGFFPSNEEDVLADACADRVDGHERPAGRFAFGRQRLDDEELEADKILVLASDDDVADHAG
jgi:hypothetical protein